MSRPTRKGFTLAELLVVIAILAVLIALFLPSVRRVRGTAALSQCQNNLKQLMLAVQGYSSAEQRFPPGCVGAGSIPEERLSWMVTLLPYLEVDSQYRRLNLEKGYEENFSAVQMRIRTFVCPSSEEATTNAAVTHYVAMSGIGIHAAQQPAGTAGNGFMGYERRTTMSMIKDGTSHTIALLETRASLGPWARGGPSTLRGLDPDVPPGQGDKPPFGGHSEGIHATMVDGSVRFLPSSIEAKKLAAIITIAGGEPDGLD